ncbi:DUF4351 domain-containing protein [Trichormus azollae]|jgi:hypothetical protein|uniref:DUF4351 domain-containing protein n=1 Tax=Trichormus azollae TaxID=1164 RepID=UPI000304AE7F
MIDITTGERISYDRGITEGKHNIVVRRLQKCLEELPRKIRAKIQTLSLNQLEELSEALLDFTASEDLFNWLENNQPE